MPLRSCLVMLEKMVEMCFPVQSWPPGWMAIFPYEIRPMLVTLWRNYQFLEKAVVVVVRENSCTGAKARVFSTRTSPPAHLRFRLYFSLLLFFVPFIPDFLSLSLSFFFFPGEFLLRANGSICPPPRWLSGSPLGALMKFIISPPLHFQQWWFRLIFLILFFGSRDARGTSDFPPRPPSHLFGPFHRHNMLLIVGVEFTTYSTCHC